MKMAKKKKEEITTPENEVVETQVVVEEQTEQVVESPVVDEAPLPTEEVAEETVEEKVEEPAEEVVDVFQERKAALLAGLITPVEIKEEVKQDNRETSSAVSHRAKPTDGRKGIYVSGFGRMGRSGKKPNKEGRATRTITHKVYEDKPIANVGKGVNAVDVKKLRGE